VPLAVRQMLWLNHNGTPAHYGEYFRQCLNPTYPGRWIGSRGPIVWLPRSPDLTAMEHLKEHGYAASPRTIEDLVARLQATVAAANMLRRVLENSVQRTAVCLELDKGRFEHLL
jgi:hypothetical protein